MVSGTNINEIIDRIENRLNRLESRMNKQQELKMIDYSLIEGMIKTEEGYRENIYLDSKGNWTGGWGSLLKLGMPLPKQVWDILFRKRFDNAIYACNYAMRLNGVELSDVRQAVIIDMAYCHGRKGIIGYKKMWAAIRVDDYDESGMQILDSSWHRDLEKQRAGRDIETRSLRAARRMKTDRY